MKIIKDYNSENINYDEIKVGDIVELRNRIHSDFRIVNREFIIINREYNSTGDSKYIGRFADGCGVNGFHDEIEDIFNNLQAHVVVKHYPSKDYHLVIKKTTNCCKKESMLNE